jgi:hypothetical protein
MELEFSAKAYDLENVFFIYKLYIYNLLSIFGVMSKFALSWCLEYRNHPLMILLQVLWRDCDD